MCHYILFNSAFVGRVAIVKDLKQVALVRALERSDQPIAHENENSDLP